MSSDPNCVFCKIIEGKIPSRKVYEDDELFVFHDIAPWAPVHFMIVPSGTFRRWRRSPPTMLRCWEGS